MAGSLNKVIKGLLLRLFNSCVGFGRFPKNWKEGEVVFFLKKGKDPKEPTSHIPICLLRVARFWRN